MFRALAAFGLYWHLTLDTILTYIFVIFFLNTGFTSIATLLISIDSILKVVLSVFFSRLVIHLPLQFRSRASIFLRFGLIGIWLISICYLQVGNIYIIILFLFFKIFLLFDMYLSADFSFSLRDHYRIDLSQTAAALNILTRSSIAFAPTLAISIINLPYMKFIIFVIFVFLGGLCTLLLKKVFFSSSDSSRLSTKNRSVPLITIISNPWMRWGLIYSIFVNFAFAGVTFIFLSQIKTSQNTFLNEITSLYLAFFLTQCVVLIFGEKIVPAKEPFHAAFLMGMCGALIIISTISESTAQLAICWGIGITYSISLSSIQKVLIPKLRGGGFIEYIGWVQMVSRLASFISTMTLGLAISLGIAETGLLVFCGLLGIISAILLVLIHPKPEEAFLFWKEI
jgi:hypothetical protein